MAKIIIPKNYSETHKTSEMVKSQITPYQEQSNKESEERIKRAHIEEAKTYVRARRYIAKTANK